MRKSILDSYDIELFTLSDQLYEFDFPIDTELFLHFENEEVVSIKGDCKLTLDKSSTMIQLEFNISAKALVACDRSLEEFNIDLESKKKMLIKYGEEYKEIDDEIVIITPDQLRLNVGQWLYEIVAVEVPMKKLHPKFENEEDVDEGFIYSDTDNKEEEEKEVRDPRWDVLRNLNIEDN